MKFVRNTWYPLVWSHDVGRSLITRKLFGEDLLLYRTESGSVAAMLDLCPHRLAPLSMGRLKGDAVECGYHGMTFGADGRCTRIPGQPIIGAKSGIKTYPTAERMGLIWVWLGDQSSADPKRIFSLAQHDDPNWCITYGDALRIDANYLNLADNLCDPSHVTFVHPTTLGNSAGENVPVQNRDIEDGVLVWRWIKSAPVIPFFAQYGSFDGPVDRWHYYYYHAPCVAVIDFGTIASNKTVSEDERGRGLQMFACHLITPVDENTCVDHWLTVRNFSLNDDAASERIHADLRIAFNEDKSILEAIQRKEAQYPDFRRVTLGVDAAPHRMRRKVDAMIAAETERAA
jgi:phenylpropionate dioxygenase-like ring-hydroxylating dioxygenase large terminal subunit